MDINWLESLLLGLISGITEFMPVSSQAHELLLLRLFGTDQAHPLMLFFIHIGVLTALIFSSSVQLKRMQREYRYAKLPPRRRRRQPDRQIVLDVALLKGAILPMALGMLFYQRAQIAAGKLHIAALLLFLNGLLLYALQYLPRGNKDSRHMSKLDSLFLGIVAAVSIFPGLSRTGLTSGIATARGADTAQAYKWALYLGIPAVIIMLCFDIFTVFVTGFAGIGFVFVILCLLSAVAAYFGALASITFMRSFTVHNGFAGFSYYCWGAALFMFILYLI